MKDMVGRRMSCWVLCLVLVLGVFVAIGQADEVLDSINEAVNNYKQGDLAEAVSNLTYAAQLIRQQRSAKLEAFLPQPAAGWSAEDVSSQSVAPALFGGMIGAERKYHKGDATVTVKITTDAPFLQGILMMFSNPMLATSDGGKLMKIKGYKAIIKYRPGTKEGELNVIIANHILVTVQGTGVEKQQLLDYASAVDYNKLKKEL